MFKPRCECSISLSTILDIFNGKNCKEIRFPHGVDSLNGLLSYFLAPTPYAHSGEMLLVVINIFLLFVQEETEMETLFDSKVRKST